MLHPFAHGNCLFMTHCHHHSTCRSTPANILQIGETMRASAYIYNTPDEISTFVAALKECAADQRQERQGAVQGQQEEQEHEAGGRQGCVIA